MEEQKRRKKRTHEEAVAAREAYLKERKAKQEARLEKARLRAEQQAARKARKEMLPEERRAARQQKQLERVKNRIRVEKDGPSYDTYKGEIKEGDFVVAIFAGSPVRGTIRSIVSGTIDIDSGEEREFQFRRGMSSVKLYDIKSEDDGLIYPVRREKIIAKR